MKHRHLGAKSIDYEAMRSRLNKVNPALKFACAIISLFICVAAKSPMVGIITLVSMSAITLCIGKISTQTYFKLLITPAAFIAVGVVVILFDFSNAQTGILNLQFFGRYLIISQGNLNDAILICARTMGAISCLYALSLSTTLGEIAGVLKKMRVPQIIIELMILIYRYIFMLLDLQNRLSIATEARLGNCGFKTRLRTFFRVSGVLMMLSFKRSGACFDAMQSRLYDGELLFLEDKKELKPMHFAFAGLYVSFLLFTTIMLGGGANAR